MRVIVRLIVVLLVLAAIGVVATWQCPASIAIPYLWKSENVVLDDLAGTIWNGHAGKISVRGQLLGQVDWQLHARPLLDRKRNADFVINGDGLSIQGNFEKFAGDTDFNDLIFRAPAALAAQFAHVDSVAPTGEVEGTIAHLAVHGGVVTDIRADVQWHKAAVAKPQPIEFGEAHLRFASTSPGNVAGDIQTARDALKFAGNFVTKGGVAESDWTNVQFHLPAQTLLLPLHVSDITLAGEVDATIPQLQLHDFLPTDIEGKLTWHDAAMSGAAQAQFGAVDAQFRKAADGSITSTISASNGALKADGTFKVLKTQPSIEADWKDVRFHFPAQLATPLMHMPNILPSGDVEGALTRMQWRDHWPKQIEGRLSWRKADISGATHAALGDIDVNFSSESERSIIGVMNDAGSATLKVDGTFKMTPEDYDVEMILAARNGDAQVSEALHHVGTLQPDGTSVLKAQGKTPALFKK
jgi:general secretion pathway protein N